MQAQVRVDCALSLCGFNSANRHMFFLDSKLQISLNLKSRLTLGWHKMMIILKEMLVTRKPPDYSGRSTQLDEACLYSDYRKNGEY
jgi:hypothetical protein